MTPEEIKEIADTVGSVLQSEEASNGPIYVLISVLVTAAPIVFRYFKKAFIKSIEKVMESHTAQMKIIIDDLHGIKNEHKELKNTVDKQGSIIDKIKEKC